MSRLLIKSDGAQTQSLELRLGTTRLGRSEDNDFQIDHPTISSRHCEILLEADSAMVRDLGSTNGTFIEGQPVKEARLQSGQTLQLGDVQMVLETTPITVAIPKIDRPSVPAPSRLPDGAAACLNHSQVRATQKCTQCHHEFCEPCVHHLRRVGGKFLNLCPLCSGRCESLSGVVKPKKKSLFARLAQTLRLPTRRKH